MKTLNYSSKERLIALLVIPPVAIAINFFVFGAAYFEGHLYPLQYDRHDHVESFP